MLDYNMLTAWGTVAIAVVTVLGLYFTTKNARLALGADLLFRLEGKFNGQDMKKERKEAAEHLLFRQGTESDSADEVFDFFDTVGLLVRRRVLDVEMTWSVFYYWVKGYGDAGEKYIAGKKGEYGSKTWEDFEYLCHKMKKLEGRDTRMTDGEIKDFLGKEKSLA